MDIVSLCFLHLVSPFSAYGCIIEVWPFLKATAIPWNRSIFVFRGEPLGPHLKVCANEETHGGHLIVYAKKMTQGGASHADGLRVGADHARTTSPVMRVVGL